MTRLLILLALLPLAGCKARDADLIALACQRAGQKLGLTRGPSAGTLTGTLRGSLGETSLSARVENRLRWDRMLADANIEVIGAGSGGVVLKGTVADLSMKQRAVDLARTTLGVERVTDELTTAPEPGE